MGVHRPRIDAKIQRTHSHWPRTSAKKKEMKMVQCFDFNIYQLATGLRRVRGTEHQRINALMHAECEIYIRNSGAGPRSIESQYANDTQRPSNKIIKYSNQP